MDCHGDIEPEVKSVNLNDVVAWTFDDPKRNDVELFKVDKTFNKNIEQQLTSERLLTGDVVPSRLEGGVPLNDVQIQMGGVMYLERCAIKAKFNQHQLLIIGDFFHIKCVDKFYN